LRGNDDNLAALDPDPNAAGHWRKSRSGVVREPDISPGLASLRRRDIIEGAGLGFLWHRLRREKQGFGCRGTSGETSIDAYAYSLSVVGFGAGPGVTVRCLTRIG
jgi:hypothetical protein